jgi:hypothetical protein
VVRVIAIQHIKHHVISVISIPCFTHCSLSSSPPSHGQLILPLLLAVVDPEDLCKFDIVEPALSICEWSTE